MRLTHSAIFASIVITMSTGFVYDDDQIASQIQNTLKAQQNAGNLQNFHLKVSVDDGIVWMKGFVTEERQRVLALEIARRIPGVKMVVKDINIVSQPGAELRTNDIGLAAAPSTSTSLPKILHGNAMQTGRQQSPSADAANSNFSQTEEANGVVTNLAYPHPLQDTSVAEAAIVANGAVDAGLGATMDQPARMSAAPVAPMTNSIPLRRSAATNQTPLAFAPAKTLLASNPTHGIDHSSSPLPANIPGVDAAAVPTRYDHANMPGYAWPSYASHPNYAALSYPQQYSAAAWPYIGPFYPYPQVPLGWRKVTLEWDDGWWWLDFQSH